MEINSRDRKILQDLFELALQADINLDDFYNSWPNNIDIRDPFIKHVYEDLEEAIQHTPGSVITGKILYNNWHNCESFNLIRIDKILIDSCSDTECMLLCRKEILRSSLSGNKNIEEEIQLCINRGLSGHS